MRWSANNKLNPLEKEVLIKLYRRNPDVRMSEFCSANNVSQSHPLSCGKNNIFPLHIPF